MELARRLRPTRQLPMDIAGGNLVIVAARQEWSLRPGPLAVASTTLVYEDARGRPVLVFGCHDRFVVGGGYVYIYKSETEKGPVVGHILRLRPAPFFDSHLALARPLGKHRVLQVYDKTTKTYSEVTGVLDVESWDDVCLAGKTVEMYGGMSGKQQGVVDKFYPYISPSFNGVKNTVRMVLSVHHMGGAHMPFSQGGDSMSPVIVRSLDGRPLLLGVVIGGTRTVDDLPLRPGENVRKYQTMVRVAAPAGSLCGLQRVMFENRPYP